jgi:enhancer of polycomb-like protein
MVKVGESTWTNEMLYFPSIPQFTTVKTLDEPMDMDVEIPEEDESTKHLAEQWRFDIDDSPAIGPEGLEEQDRVLVSDYGRR